MHKSKSLSGKFENIFNYNFKYFRTQTKIIRRGYMGHLINIVNNIVNSCTSTTLGQFLKETLPDVNEKLKEFKESTLTEINKTQETLLVSFHIS